MGRLTLSRPLRNETHTFVAHIPYKIPNTDIVLELAFGHPIQSNLITYLLSIVLGDLNDQMHTHGAAAWLPYGEYDYMTDDGVEFSAYSPSELPQARQLTWQIVHTVVDGLIDLLVLQRRYREVSFKIKDGADRVLVGYGHLVQQRPPMIRGS